MAIPNGKPSTDFSAMNREYIREVAKEEAAAGGSGIPAPANPSNGDVLTYNSTSEKWEAASPPESGIPAPASPSDGDVLTYDSTTSSWGAEAPSGGGGVFFVGESLDEINNKQVLNKTAGEIIAAAETSVVILKSLLYGQVNTMFFYLKEHTVDRGYVFDFGVEDGPYICNTLNDYPALNI